MEEYIKIEIKEIVENGVKAKYNGEINFYHEYAFLDYKNINIGDEIELKFDTRREKYNQLGLTFDNEYRKNKFEEGKVYQALLLKKISNFWIVKVQGNKFGRIYPEEMNRDREYKQYDIINVSLKKKSKGVVFSIFEAAFNIFKEEINNKSDFYPFEIIDVKKKINSKKNITAYEFYTKQGIKIFIPIRDKVLFEKNYHYFKDALLVEKELSYDFYYCSKKEHFNLWIENNLQLDKNKPYIGELDYNETTNNYYIETSKGHCKLNIDNLTYLEKNILNYLIGKDITYNKKLQDSRVFRDNIILHRYTAEDIKAIKYSGNKKRIFKNVKIVNVIDTKTDQRLYVVDLEELGLGFMEKTDYSYTNDIALIGDIIDKLQVKDIINNHFIFLTRKPFLTDPKEKYFEDIEIGEKVPGKVKKIYEEFILVTFNDEFDIPILKENLLPLKFYKIHEFYKEGNFADFYLFKKNPDIQLTGYNRNEYRKKIEYYSSRKGELVDGNIYKKMITKYIVRLEKYIEAQLPVDEISHLEDDINKLKASDIKYNFKILNVEEDNDGNPRIILSRKQLSDTTYAYQRKYKVGSIVKGSFFYRTSNGFYFNLKHNQMEIKGLVGFLANEEVALYPDLDVFHKQLINKDEIKFKIISYPNKLRKDPYLHEKAISLSRVDMLDFDIKEYYENLNPEDIILKETDLLEGGLKYRSQANRIYFEKNINKDYTVIFSLNKNNFIPGVEFDDDFNKEFKNYFKRLKEYINKNYKSISNKERELLRIILNVRTLKNINEREIILSSLNKDYFNNFNNTIEVSYADYIFSVIKSRFSNNVVEIKRDEENNKYGYLFNNEILGIKIYLDENVKVGKKYKISIVDYIDKENRIIGKVKALNKDSIGQDYPLKIIEQIDKNKYKVKYLGDNYGILKNKSKSKLVVKEIIYGTLISQENDTSIFYYEFPGENLVTNISNINLKQFSVNDLYNFITEKNNLNKLKQADILRVYKALQEKSRYIDYDFNINFKDVIYLLENGFLRDSYIFDSKVYGQGNFGQVFKGVNLINMHQVICKRYTSNRQDDIERRRFTIEARTLQKLDLEGIPKCLKYIPETNEYIAEYIEGVSLSDFIKENLNRDYLWKKKKYTNILSKVAGILDELSLEGIVHCDIKPANIIYDKRNDKVAIIDFGSIQNEEIKGGFGTIFYASPEQCRIYSNPHLHNTAEHSFETRDDIYSFGVMAYEIFAGRLPYTDELEEETIIIAHQYGQKQKGYEYSFKKPSFYNEEIDKDLEDIILKCMKTDRSDRYTDFFELQKALEVI